MRFRKCLRSVLAFGVVASFFVVIPIFGDDQAVKGTVTGKVQMVGFRAAILKQAIAQNLAGTAKNNADGTVFFQLQGDSMRIKTALAKIADGTDRSSDVKVTTDDDTINSALKTFTVFGWTSTSRGITKPYNLVFSVRSDGSVLSKGDAHKAYHEILRKTLDPDDQKKLRDADDD
jgi:acylphosphatase